jgi:hypothetical protein
VAAVRADDGALRDDLVIPQGSTWNRSWDITDTAGNPATLTGWSAQSQIRPSPGAATLLFEWNTTSGPGIGVATITGSTVQIELTGIDSALWAFLSGSYDVYLTDTNGSPTRIVEGSVRVSPSVTH